MVTKASYRLLPTKDGKASLHPLTASAAPIHHAEVEQEEEKQKKHEPGTAALHGIYYPDTDYDYTQHLKKTGQYTDAITVLIPTQRRKKVQKQQLPPPEEKKEEWKKEVEEVDERMMKEDVQVILRKKRTGEEDDDDDDENDENDRKEEETQIEQELEDILQMLDIGGTGKSKRPKHQMNPKLFIGQHESGDEEEEEDLPELETSDKYDYTDDEYNEYQDPEDYEQVS